MAASDGAARPAHHVPANPHDVRSEPVLYWHHEGFSPGQIDHMLDLPEGTARRRVVEHWRKGRQA